MSIGNVVITIQCDIDRGGNCWNAKPLSARPSGRSQEQAHENARRLQWQRSSKKPDIDVCPACAGI